MFVKDSEQKFLHIQYQIQNGGYIDDLLNQENIAQKEDDEALSTQEVF